MDLRGSKTQKCFATLQMLGEINREIAIKSRVIPKTERQPFLAASWFGSQELTPAMDVPEPSLAGVMVQASTPAVRRHRCRWTAS